MASSDQWPPNQAPNSRRWPALALFMSGVFLCLAALVLLMVTMSPQVMAGFRQESGTALPVAQRPSLTPTGASSAGQLMAPIVSPTPPSFPSPAVLMPPVLSTVPTNPPPPTPSPVPTSLPPPTLSPVATDPLPSSAIFPTVTLTSVTAIPPTSDGPASVTFQIGQSVLGQPIEIVRIGNGHQRVLFVGGIHSGHSPGSVSLAHAAADHFSRNPGLVPDSATMYVLLDLNPDSEEATGRRLGRLNANGVDLNRNWDCDWARDAEIEGNLVPGSGGEAPLSEPETQALASFITASQISAVVFWEAFVPNGVVSPGVCNGVTTVSNELAEAYGRGAGYQVAQYASIDRAIQGDASNWLDSQGIAAIFVMLPNHTTTDWERNLSGIMAVLNNQ